MLFSFFFFPFFPLSLLYFVPFFFLLFSLVNFFFLERCVFDREVKRDEESKSTHVREYSGKNFFHLKFFSRDFFLFHVSFILFKSSFHSDCFAVFFVFLSLFFFFFFSFSLFPFFLHFFLCSFSIFFFNIFLTSLFWSKIGTFLHGKREDYTITTITEYFWRFTVEYEILAYEGNTPDKKVKKKERKENTLIFF